MKIKELLSVNIGEYVEIRKADTKESIWYGAAFDKEYEGKLNNDILEAEVKSIDINSDGIISYLVIEI